MDPFNIDKIIKLLNIKVDNFKKDKIYDIKDLSNADKKDLTFFIQKNIKN